MTPDDDYTHDVTDEPNFNESMYFQFYDGDAGLGGFLRLANRPNEGHAERTVCLYLPDGRVAFSYDRPTITGNDRLSSGGLTVTVLEPMESLEVTFEGEVNVLADPHSLADPKAALSTSPTVGVTARLTFSRVGPPYAETFDDDGGSFAPNHYEQSMRVAGDVTIDGESRTVAGYGLRDHSWGPRSWQAPWFYRWAHGTGGSVSFMAAYFGNPDGTSRRGGFVVDDGELIRCDSVEITTSRDESDYQRNTVVTLSCADRAWVFEGDVHSSVPLRNRKRDGDGWAITRIVEGATVWTTPRGETIHGMTEYLDQIVDAVPVGLSV